jgi:lipoate-protein ligase A
LGIENLNSKGISDLSIGDKKIMGSSMYLKGNDLFYHAVLNVSEEVSLISKYLKHPKKEPDYRKGRPHNEFVTSLHAEGYYIDVDVIMDSVRKALESLQK